MPERALNIGICTHDFIHLPGARDLLRTFVRALTLRKEVNLFLIMFGPEMKVERHDYTDYVTGLADRIINVPDLPRRLLQKAESMVWRQRSEGGGKEESYYVEEARKHIGDLVDSCAVVRADHVFDIVKVARTYEIDVFIPMTVGVHGVPFVSYLYDCQHKYFPQYFSEADVAARNKHFRDIIDASKSLIVASADTKKDIQKFFKVGDCKIFDLPCYPNVDEEALESAPHLLEKYKLPPRYFMCSNQFWVHKSLETTLHALGKLVDQGEADMQIVYTGQMEDVRVPGYIDSLMDLVRILGLERHTQFLGYIPKRDQMEIMKNCIAMIQPTLFEGGAGGGSVLAATALGVRSIVSDIPVNLELPGQEGFLEFFTAGDSDSLAQMMRKFWYSPPYSRPDNSVLIESQAANQKRFSDRLYDAISNAIPLKFSIITVCKNAEKYIEQTLWSVLDQSYRNFEIIVIDGESTDRTLDILKAYDAAGDIRLYSGKDGGIYFAMNKGLKHVTGDIVFFLNSGDFLADSEVLGGIHAAFKGDPDTTCVIGNTQFRDEAGNNTRFLDNRSFVTDRQKYRNNSQCHQVTFYKKELFDKYGDYDTSFRVYGDQEFHARVFAKENEKMTYVPITVVSYLQGGFSDQMLQTGVNAAEKRRIEQMYFEPPWVNPVERLSEAE